jgi:hypothetical protein
MAGDVKAMPWVTDHTKKLEKQPNVRLVEELERLLEGAKSGSVYGLAYATQTVDNTDSWGWITDDTMDLLASVALLEHRMKDYEVRSTIVEVGNVD